MFCNQLLVLPPRDTIYTPGGRKGIVRDLSLALVNFESELRYRNHNKL